MTVTTRTTSRLEVDATPPRPPTAAEVVLWAADLPGHAVVSAILREVGSQRDPETVTVGLVAVWGGQ